MMAMDVCDWIRRGIRKKGTCIRHGGHDAYKKAEKVDIWAAASLDEWQRHSNGLWMYGEISGMSMYSHTHALAYKCFVNI